MNESRSLVQEQNANLKEKAVEYYSAKSAIYNERYSVKAGGDLLWVRHHAVLEAVRGWGLPLSSRILDLGCGPGLITRELAGMGYGGVGLDASPAMIEHCKREASGQRANSWTYQLGDVESLPFPDKSLDAAICMGVIDYLPTDDKLLAETARILKPGGRFLLCVTNQFGYTVSLSTPVYWLKKIPGMRSFASWLRSALVGGSRGAMGFNFLPRKHRPSVARQAAARHGFSLESDRYVHFSLLPAPFCAMTSKLGTTVDEKLNALGGTRLRGVGSCYMMNTIRI